MKSQRERAVDAIMSVHQVLARETSTSTHLFPLTELEHVLDEAQHRGADGSISEREWIMFAQMRAELVWFEQRYQTWLRQFGHDATPAPVYTDRDPRDQDYEG